MSIALGVEIMLTLGPVDSYTEARAWRSTKVQKGTSRNAWDSVGACASLPSRPLPKQRCSPALLGESVSLADSTNPITLGDVAREDRAIVV